jgi:hypothetical protein
VFWPHTKTSVFFNKHQKNVPARIADLNSEIPDGLFLPPSFKTQVSIID